MAKPNDAPATEPTVKDLFSSVDILNGKIDALKAQLEALEESKSNVVFSIYRKAGKGPFSRGGKVLTIVGRSPNMKYASKEEKDSVPDSRKTWFFKGEAMEKEITSMD